VSARVDSAVGVVFDDNVAGGVRVRVTVPSRLEDDSQATELIAVPITARQSEPYTVRISCSFIKKFNRSKGAEQPGATGLRQMMFRDGGIEGKLSDKRKGENLNRLPDVLLLTPNGGPLHYLPSLEGASVKIEPN